MHRILLSAPDQELEIDLPLCGRTLDLLTAQLARLQDSSATEDFAKRLAARVDDAIAQCVELGLRKPSKYQINTATRIASEFGIVLTPDVLRYREEMDAFLAAHVKPPPKRAPDVPPFVSNPPYRR